MTGSMVTGSSSHAAIAKDELTNARVPAPEDGLLAGKLAVGGRFCERVIWPGRARGRRGVVAVVDRAIEPADAQKSLDDMLFADHERVAQAIRNRVERNSCAPRRGEWPICGHHHSAESVGANVGGVVAQRPGTFGPIEGLGPSWRNC